MAKEGIQSKNKEDRFELLRGILEHEQHQAVTYSDAKAIGESLLSFYEVLASDLE